MKTLLQDHDLEKAIPFLLARAGARMGNAFAKALKPYGLSLSEWRVCASLQHTPRQTLSELATHASTDLSALSRIVDRLVGMNWWRARSATPTSARCALRFDGARPGADLRADPARAALRSGGDLRLQRGRSEDAARDAAAPVRQRDAARLSERASSFPQAGDTCTVEAARLSVIAKRTGRKRSITAQLVRVCSVTSLQVKAQAFLPCHTASASSSAS
jgi:hypothetical protein